MYKPVYIFIQDFLFLQDLVNGIDNIGEFKIENNLLNSSRSVSFIESFTERLYVKNISSI